MKKLSLILSIVCTLYIHLNAQEVFSSSGNYKENANISVSWTIGEPITETQSNEINIITQGFQQSKLSVVSVSELTNETIKVKIAPNPTNDYINLFIDNFKDVRYELSDFNGRIIESKYVNGCETKIFFSELSSSVYFLKIVKDSQIINTYKVIKQ